MCRRLVHVKTDHAKLTADHAKLTADLARKAADAAELKKRLSDQAESVRGLKEANTRLTDDNQVIFIIFILSIYLSIFLYDAILLE